MNEHIDLTRILKDCPKGWKLWSPIFGEIEFCSIAENAHYPIILSCKKGTIWFSKEGLFDIENEGAECLLFPSKDQRDWEKFTAPWYKKEKFDPNTLKPFDKVLACLDDKNSIWCCGLFSCFEENMNLIRCCGDAYYKYCIPYNDDTKHILGTANEPPEYYKYWEN